MEVQLIRNATVKIQYAGKTILVDPYFADKHSQPTFCGKSKNPTVDLPLSIDEIMDGVDVVFITHLHPDHFDEMAQNTLPKGIKIFCQPADQEKIQSFGFENVEPIEDKLTFGRIEIIRTNAQHGKGFILPVMGEVSGFILKAEKEKSVYITGDTIWNEEIAQYIGLHQPEVIIANAGGNEFKKEYDLFQIGMKEDSGPVIMDEKQLMELCQSSGNGTKIIAAHLGSLDHETVSRESLRTFADKNGIDNGKLLIPEDGESIEF